MRIELIFGPVASGKSTALAKYDPDKWVRYSPGGVLRAAVGTSMFRGGDRPNAPPDLDDFVFGMFLEHFRLAVKLGRGLVAELPRTEEQATRLVCLLNECFKPAADCVIAHGLHITKATWERRCREGRWAKDPTAEPMDRLRWPASVRDFNGAMGVLSGCGRPYVLIRHWSEDHEFEVQQ